MAQIIYEDPVVALKGKICRHKKTIFKVFSPSQTNYTCQICNPRNMTEKPFSENELEVQNNFATASINTAAALADPVKKAQYIAAFQKEKNSKKPKYCTLRGYIFAMEYAKLSESAQ